MEGKKFDQNKTRMDLIPPELLLSVGDILTSGANKYGDRNWEKGMLWSRPYGALLRHLLAWWGGEDKDPESGRSHLWHVATNAAFLLTYEIRKIGQDDRPKKLEAGVRQPETPASGRTNWKIPESRKKSAI